MSDSAEQPPPARYLPEVHLHPNVRSMRQSPTVAINEACNRLLQSGMQVFKLGLGQSPFPVPPSVVEALQANAYRKDYLQVQGLQELREAVADYQRRTHGLVCKADDILIGPGSKELMFLLQVVYCGDLVVPTPAWVSYAPQARIMGRRVSFLSTSAGSSWRLDPGQIEDLCRAEPDRPRILVLNYPGNPTGGTYTAAELEGIAEVARRFGVVLLSDEIYGELHHQGQHVSVARFYPEGTIISSGLSKWSGAGGWRLGTFTFPRSLGWLLETMVAVASETYTSTCAPIQYAAIKAFQGGIRIERYLWNVRRILRALGATVVERLSGAGLRIAPPAGAFYVFPDFSGLAPALAERGIYGSPGLVARLLEETGVAILPGTDFGRPPGELTARLAYVDFDGTRALAAAETLPREEEIGPEFLDTYCRNVLTAVDRVSEWVRGLPAAKAGRQEPVKADSTG